MSLDRNKHTVRRLYEEVVGEGKTDLLDELIAPDATDHNARARGWGSGREGMKVHARVLGEAFSDLTLVVDDLVAEEDQVIAFWHFRGVHRGTLWGIAPTGRTVEAHTITIIRLRDGQVVEYESRPDRLTLLQQLGSLGDYGAAFE